MRVERYCGVLYPNPGPKVTCTESAKEMFGLAQKLFFWGPSFRTSMPPLAPLPLLGSRNTRNRSSPRTHTSLSGDIHGASPCRRCGRKAYPYIYWEFGDCFVKHPSPTSKVNQITGCGVAVVALLDGGRTPSPSLPPRSLLFAPSLAPVLPSTTFHVMHQLLRSQSERQSVQPRAQRTAGVADEILWAVWWRLKWQGWSEGATYPEHRPQDAVEMLRTLCLTNRLPLFLPPGPRLCVYSGCACAGLCVHLRFCRCLQRLPAVG